MAYLVQNMTLIPQALKMSCWYASARMLIQWKQESTQSSIAGLIDPELDAECQKIRDGKEVLVYDPSPVNVGKKEWRSLSGWYVGGSSSSRDTGKDVEAVFLHCP